MLLGMSAFMAHNLFLFIVSKTPCNNVQITYQAEHFQLLVNRVGNVELEPGAGTSLVQPQSGGGGGGSDFLEEKMAMLDINTEVTFQARFPSSPLDWANYIFSVCMFVVTMYVSCFV